MKKKNTLIISLYVICLIFLIGIVVYTAKNHIDKSENVNNIEDDNALNTPNTHSIDNGETLDDYNSLNKNTQMDKDSQIESSLDENISEDTKNEDISIDMDNNKTDTVDIRTEPIILTFAGDINLNEDSRPVKRYDREDKGILGCLSPELVEEMNSADIMMLNNEFAYSTRGSKIQNKSYTFRAHPKRVDILYEMGVDIVSLANNHSLDYGEDALLDTFDTLEDAGIDYVGAGINIDRAMKPIYYTIGDTTIAYLAASRVIYAMDWYATDTRPGMIGTYDPKLFLSSIEEANSNSDYVVVYVHWGIEKSHDIVDYQKQLAENYVDAGADIIVGCHPHVMQGIDIYKGKLIAYSLGNYWFNSVKRETGLLKIFLALDGTIRAQLLPAMGKDTYTYLITHMDEKKNYYDFMRDISYDIEFDENGFIIDIGDD